MIAREQIRFDPEAHLYQLAGEDVPSVTQVLDAEGLAGCEYWKEEHRQRGTAVHRIAALLGRRQIRGATVDEIVYHSAWEPARTAPALVGYGCAVAQFYLDTGFKPELVEQIVASERFRICGTLDQWGRMPNGEQWLIDFKSGEPQPAAQIQTALYVMCLEETLALATDKRAVVWLRPDGSYKMLPPRPAGGTDLSIGQCAVNLYHWRQRNRMLN